MGFPPSDKSLGGVLKDTRDRLDLVERRLATGGGGSGESNPPAAGMIMPFAGATAPTGWLLCDGAAVSRTTYATLFGAIGTVYGAGDGSTTFNLPNLKGRVPYGQDGTQAEFDVLGESGGAKTHTLTINEMPSHAHQWNAAGLNALNSQPSNWDDIVGAGAAALGVGPTNVDTADNAIKPRGGGAAHNNLPPYVVTNYIISTGSGAGVGTQASGGSGGGGSISAGVVSPWAGAATGVPAGWLLCDGSAVGRAAYSALFKAIGVVYGAGDGVTTFNLPNYKGRTLVGLDAAQTEFDALGETGGEKAHTLTVAEIPTHDHTVNFAADSGVVSNNVYASGPTSTTQRIQKNGPYGGASGVAGAGLSGDRGGGGAHNNLQPYSVANYIIATGVSQAVAGSTTVVQSGLVLLEPSSVVGGVVEGSVVRFTNASAVSFNSIFNSLLYDDYVVEVRFVGAEQGGWLRLRKAGTDLAGSFYGNQQTFNSGPSAVATNYNVTIGAIFSIVGGTQGEKFTAKVSNPAGTGLAYFDIEQVIQNSGAITSGRNSVTVGVDSGPYDGFSLVSSSGTFTGTIAVYGMAKVQSAGMTIKPTRGTTAQRDAAYGVPASAAEQSLLANQVIEWFNTDKGYTEIYYATTGTTGLTAKGLATGFPSGWYPAAGSMIWGTCAMLSAQSVAAGEVRINLNTGELVGGMATGNNVMIVPIGGVYETSAHLYIWGASGTYRGVQAFNVADGTVVCSGTTSAIWDIIAVPRRIRIAAGAQIGLKTAGDAANTIQGQNWPAIEMRYIGPPLVNG